jgi:hypothetical protein
MDNLLKAIDISAPTKGREDATVDGYPASLTPSGRPTCTIPVQPRN